MTKNQLRAGFGFSPALASDSGPDNLMLSRHISALHLCIHADTSFESKLTSVARCTGWNLGVPSEKPWANHFRVRTWQKWEQLSWHFGTPTIYSHNSLLHPQDITSVLNTPGCCLIPKPPPCPKSTNLTGDPQEYVKILVNAWDE